MIRHVVAFQLTEQDPALRSEQAASAAAQLNALVGVVPSLRAMSAGANALYADVNWDLVLVADFDDHAGLEAYDAHPEHKKVAGFIGSIRSARVAVDFEL